jgi:pimeloyl-ACP methyl ester carboxylesterase
MAPTVEALASHFRVVTFSLSGERSSGFAMDVARGFDNYVDQIARVLDDRHLRSAIVCGVSFGGLVALRFAAVRPERTAALVLVSTPAPGWHLRPKHTMYLKAPWLFGPVFIVETPLRLRDEVRRAIPRRRDRWAFGLRQAATLLRAPVSIRRMAERGSLLTSVNLGSDCARVSAPTLVVTGEPGLDHVVPTQGSSEYAALIANARTVVLEHTGHVGSVTRPDAFASLVRKFISEVNSRPAARAGGRAVS